MTGSLLATAGPFMGVRDNLDAPYTNAAKYLLSATNGYFRDAAGLSSWLARPAIVTTNPSAQIGTGQPGQGTHAHVDPATGTIYRFFAVDGKLYRSDSALATFTDVSPVGITIDNSLQTRVAFLSVGASMVATDGVNRPWVASNFASTPITGTYIDIDGGSGAWSAYGKPTIYEDSVMFITATVPSGSAVEPRVGFVWSEPNQPAVGYTQSGYADFWNMIQTGSDPLYCILGTNSGLFLWRKDSITVATGTPSINFSSTASRDARGDAIGSVSSFAVALFGSNIFFVDAYGRPWMMPLDGDPQPIWQQLASLVATASTAILADLPYTAIGAIVPELNRYIVAIWRGAPITNPVSASVFDGSTGAYDGEWNYNGVSGQIGWDVVDVQLDSTGNRVLCIVGGASGTGGRGGYVALLKPLAANVWQDSPVTQVAQLRTERIGYSVSSVMSCDHANIVVRSPETMVGISPLTPYGEVAISAVTPVVQPGSPITPFPGEDRAVIGMDGTATRWVSFAIAGPANPTKQWGLQRIEIFGSTSLAGPDDA